jgi:hypothetical protein
MKQLHSDQIDQIITALSKAQGEFTCALKDSNNPFFKSKYADLSSYWKACNEPLAKNGLALVQCTDEIDGKLYLISTLAHTSGQWFKSYLPVIAQKPDAQSLGSAITYMRRYSLAAILGIVTDEDDDGEKAGRAKPAEYINPTQVGELSHLFDKCDPSHVEKIWGTLRKSGVDSYSKITLDLFDRLKKAAEINIKEFISKKSEVKNEQSDSSGNSDKI